MITKEYLINLLKENGVFLKGDFTLSSGKKSDYYINMKKAITDPEILSTIAKLITKSISEDNIDKVAGPALGAVPIATAVSLESEIPLLMIRKEKKGYGTSKLIEGELNEGDDVIVVEDVTTTGGSLLKAIKAIQDNGGNVELIINDEIFESLMDNIETEIKKKSIRNGCLKVHKLKENLNLYLIISDKNTNLGLFKSDGSFDQNRLLTSENQQAIKWANNLFENVKANW